MRAVFRLLTLGLICVTALWTVHVRARTTRQSYVLRALADEWAVLDNEARWLEGEVVRRKRPEHLLATASDLGVVVGVTDGPTRRIPPRQGEVRE